ncbi:MAG: hypothetical protein A2451_08200, partial [Bdellovibrionales bacterium RIFOXYC2_FULL_39_8]
MRNSKKPHHLPAIFLLNLIILHIWAEEPKRLCDLLEIYECPSNTGRGYNRSVGASMPTSSSAFNSNPSALSMDKGFGLELLAAGGTFDFSAVSGTGRVGAGITTSMPENTFFGNTTSENPIDYATRIEDGEKFQSKKYNLAGAMNLYGKKQNSVFNLNAGTMVVYNKDTKKSTFGGCGSVSLGPISFGMATLSDYWQHYDIYLPEQEIGDPVKYPILSTSWGLKLPFLAMDYTKLVNKVPDHEFTVTIFTVGIYYKSWIFTYSKRTELSERAT